MLYLLTSLRHARIAHQSASLRCMEFYRLTHSSHPKQDASQYRWGGTSVFPVVSYLTCAVALHIGSAHVAKCYHWSCLRISQSMTSILHSDNFQAPHFPYLRWFAASKCNLIGFWRMSCVCQVPGVEVLNFDVDKDVTKKLKEMTTHGPDVGIEAVGLHYTKSLSHKIQTTLGLETDSGDMLNEIITSVRKVHSEHLTVCCILVMLEASSSVTRCIFPNHLAADWGQMHCIQGRYTRGVW